MASRESITGIAAYLHKTLGETIPSNELDGWADVLSPIPDSVALEAVRCLVRTLTYRKLPAPGAIYQAALGIMRERFPSMGEAWELARCGTDMPGPVRVAYDRIGAGTMMNLREGDGSTRARFLDFYREAVDAAALAVMANPRMEIERSDAPALPDGVESLPVYDGTPEQRAALLGGEADGIHEIEIPIKEMIRGMGKEAG